MTQVFKPRFKRRPRFNKAKFAAKMRRKMTYSERLLWPLLKAHGFKAQVLLRGYIADFAHPKTRIIVEADGEYHEQPDKKEADQLRDWHLFQAGYKVLRYSNKEIIAAPETVVEALLNNFPSRYSRLPKSSVSSSSRKHVLQRPSVQTATA